MLITAHVPVIVRGVRLYSKQRDSGEKNTQRSHGTGHRYKTREIRAKTHQHSRDHITSNPLGPGRTEFRD